MMRPPPRWSLEGRRVCGLRNRADIDMKQRVELLPSGLLERQINRDPAVVRQHAMPPNEIHGLLGEFPSFSDLVQVRFESGHFATVSPSFFDGRGRSFWTAARAQSGTGARAGKFQRDGRPANPGAGSGDEHRLVLPGFGIAHGN